MKKRLFLVIIIALALFYTWSRLPVRHGPGVVAPYTPRQKELPEAQFFTHEGYKITPLALFELEARILSTKHYKYGREAELCPVDLALGWGPMSDERVLDRLSISQSQRFYYWWAKELPLPRTRISVFSANMHMIPANADVAKQLRQLRKGEIVEVGGYLVKVESGDGWRWKSSLTRKDTGAGACELVWVEELGRTR